MNERVKTPGELIDKLTPVEQRSVRDFVEFVWEKHRRQQQNISSKVTTNKTEPSISTE